MGNNVRSPCVHYDCQDRTDSGYCRYTTCGHPMYSIEDNIRLVPSNMICPKCNYKGDMYYLEGRNVGNWNMKCLNCNSYFRSLDFQNEEKQEEPNICKMEWIDVKDKLPDNDDFVIVAIYDENGDTPFWETNFGWYFDRAECWIVDTHQRTDILYWMPLPEPPKEN